jgi:hypothetical protein
MEKFKDARISAMSKQLQWYDFFMEYVQEVDINMYNKAFEYADKQQKL